MVLIESSAIRPLQHKQKPTTTCVAQVGPSCSFHHENTPIAYIAQLWLQNDNVPVDNFINDVPTFGVGNIFHVLPAEIERLNVGQW